ncbi:MAG: glycosyltransferase [Lautropia sp.]|nr:glycosyltransferase [Lautropia sp.]
MSTRPAPSTLPQTDAPAAPSPSPSRPSLSSALGSDTTPAQGEPLRVLYLVSLFPCWSETFIVREIRALQARGAEVRILSLKAASETMVQPDAQTLLDRVIYPPATLSASLCSGLPQLLRRPLRSLSELATLVGSLWKRPTELLKSVVAWWRTLAVIGPVRHFNPHHVHAHWATYPSTAARILAGRIQRPWSFTSHAHDIFVHDHDLSGKLCQADFSVTISDYNRRKLSGRMPLPLRDKLAVVHCGILPDEIPFEPDGRQPRRIVAVGRLDPIKGFIHLIEACRLLHDRRIDFHCEIIGDGPLKTTLQQAIAQARLGEHVHLAGALPQQDVRRRIREAAIFVLPSVQLADGNADGIPVALMEAMASGATVVSTRVSGIPELIEHDLSGLLAPPGQAAPLADAMARLLGDAPLRQRLAVMARQVIVEDFDANREADKLLALIQRVHAGLPMSGEGSASMTAEATRTLTADPTRPPSPPVPRPMPLRVMIVTDEMEVGGSQRQIVQLATGLKALQIECVVVYFLNPSFLVEELHAAGVETIRVDKRKPVDLRFLRQLRQTIHTWRPDVLHGFSFTAELWSTVAVRLLPCRQRPALVSSVRGTYEWYNSRQWCLKRWVSRNSLAIVSNSREGAAYAAEQMHWPATLFSIVPNGVRLHQPASDEVRLLRNKYLPTAARAITENASPSSAADARPAPSGSAPAQAPGMLLLFVGRLVEHKNLPRLLDAFATLAHGRPQLRLLLVGSGPLGPSLMAHTTRLGLTGQVLMLGERDDVPALMAAADIVVAPSLREGLSNVILEAMALGRPIVATRVGGTPEAIDDGENGLLVDPLDTDALAAAMQRLVEDAPLRQRLGEAARHKVLEHYSPQAMVKSMLKEYQRVSQR